MKKLGLDHLQRLKERGRKAVILTASSYLEARYIDASRAVDALLVSDSIGRLRLGYSSDLSVTLEEMLHHVKSVTRSDPGIPVIADMPYLTYETSPMDAARNAGRLIKEGLADAVRCEGGARVINSIQEILRANVAVVGHLSRASLAVKWRAGISGPAPHHEKHFPYLMEQAQLLEKTGCAALVIEGFPASWGRELSINLKIPVIVDRGGFQADGVIFLTDELIGMDGGRMTGRPKNTQATLGALFLKAIRQAAVQARR
ncbi:MAG: 3-methyl-2-oxobutanoate hydroxymethyltransferase [Elusimicrobia bacterium]|nr:3-methyl-2-oxobutanoate hydroxymethyltransferase [Elusimicrobiota bacterium]